MYVYKKNQVKNFAVHMVAFCPPHKTIIPNDIKWRNFDFNNKNTSIELFCTARRRIDPNIRIDSSFYILYYI